jgi:hypothetical protein
MNSSVVIAPLPQRGLRVLFNAGGVFSGTWLTAASDDVREHNSVVLLFDASSCGRPTVTPASAGLLDAKSEDQRLMAEVVLAVASHPASAWRSSPCSGSREIDPGEIDGAEATRGLTLARIDVDLRHGRHERFDAVEPRDRAKAAVAALGFAPFSRARVGRSQWDESGRGCAGPVNSRGNGHRAVSGVRSLSDRAGPVRGRPEAPPARAPPERAGAGGLGPAARGPRRASTPPGRASRRSRRQRLGRGSAGRG